MSAAARWEKKIPRKTSKKFGECDIIEILINVSNSRKSH